MGWAVLGVAPHGCSRDALGVWEGGYGGMHRIYQGCAKGGS